MKKIFWTSVFWWVVIAAFRGYMRWFDQGLAQDVVRLIAKQTNVQSVECPLPTLENNEIIVSSGDVSVSSEPTIQTLTVDPLETKFEEIKKELQEINEKLDIQNSNTPDAVSVSLRTTKKTNVFVFPLDGSEYKKYTLNASDDILRDTLNILFEKSPFALVDNKLDNDGNLILTVERVPGTSFGGSAAVGQVITSIEKTALQFSQIKKVIITPEDVIQP